MKKNIRSYILEHKAILLALLVLLIYLSPNIFFPEKARFLIHDNLDSNPVWYKNLAESGKMFASNDAIIPNSLGGIPRGCYPSEYNVNHLLYLLFEPLQAYNLNIILVHFLAFFSMLVFTRKYIFNYNDNKNWSIGVSLLYALLPFWPAGGLTLATQPLLIYAFLNIFNYDLRFKNWFIIFLIPFFSILIHANFFLLILSFLFCLVYFVINKKINYYKLLSFALFTAVSVFTENRLLRMQFIEHFESHRSILNLTDPLNYKGVIGVSILHFLKGQYHFISLQFPFILILSISTFLFAKKRKEKYVILFLWLFLYFISFLFVLPEWDLLNDFLKKYKLLSIVSMRFYSLFPIVWYILLSYSASILYKLNFRTKIYTIVILLMQGIVSVLSISDKDYYNSNFTENSFYRTFIQKNSSGHKSFKDYYKFDLFNLVKKKIPIDTFYVGCININPEIIQFNGYWTIDGYYFYYPKTKIDLVNKICEKENLKSRPEGADSRCYLWSDDIFKKKNVLDNLELNYDLLKKEKVKYIFSEYRILNNRLIDEIHLVSNKDSIFIYTIL